MFLQSSWCRAWSARVCSFQDNEMFFGLATEFVMVFSINSLCETRTKSSVGVHDGHNKMLFLTRVISISRYHFSSIVLLSLIKQSTNLKLSRSIKEKLNTHTTIIERKPKK
uniref:(northern house mosquito) hypothetical protein n=1 Tax=Culex pipiens TaxID=7175 RepID=A0A8D8BGL4_CULPI